MATTTRQVKQVRGLSEQDYGPFLQVLTHWVVRYQDGDKHFVCVNAGYEDERNNQEAWYELDGEPTLPGELSDLCLDPLTDQSEVYGESSELQDLLGVGGELVDSPQRPVADQPDNSP